MIIMKFEYWCVKTKKVWILFLNIIKIKAKHVCVLTRELGCTPVPTFYTHIPFCQLHFVVRLEELRDLFKVLRNKRHGRGQRDRDA